MNEIIQGSQGSERELLVRAAEVIEEGQAAAARQANLALTLTFWRLGRLIGEEVLGSKRATYGEQIVVSLGRQLVERYGRSYEDKNLRRMIQFARQFPEEQMVVSLGRQLSWTHFRALLPLKSPEARAFYAQEAIAQGLSVRGLRHLISRKAFERRAIANTQLVGDTSVPRDVFRDPYLLDFLGLKDTFLERDLEAAIVRDMEAFLLEAGNGFAFVERQKRMIIDDDDYHLDLLFYSRPLRRLIAVELKIGKFKASYEGQMKLYLKWLDRHERREDEESPIGLILCTETGREQIELLEMHKDGIVVAEYWTELPPRAELQARIQQIYQTASERVARREIESTSKQEDTK
ncbi:PDDEXK nuclease domain-containing protein [Gulosibacter hominis]|uniref:PDDEXK nuclease domain-containing protein n=1 Tax=Gulosibacter hominis TaxID=2770504 RepID=UPI001917F937|nr:PDDEXK nuclease domain-containing protein [Gulosibacter hominis]